ncbi:MAG: IS3 family transposase [Lachnospiraceae bacterium]|nr:IS3 family transposase [Lachnospiraceae bacterium]
MVDSFINKQKSKLNGYNVSQCLRMFGVSDSGYYAWKGRKEDIFGKQAEKKADRDAIKELMRRIIIARNGVVPGKRTFRVELFRRFGRTVNTKKIAALMAEMNIQAQMPHKDAYKHQASHNHVCAAPVNAVNQNFFIAPRRVILSDITYLYYGEYRTTFYLCVFRDAYTRENLGWSIGRYMSLKLVEEAYRDMMSGHAGELAEVMRTNEVYVHHDQGSQYLATSFTELLHDDGFVQSVSARGNSQDNAPMESFFGRLKTAILDMVAMCRDFTSARQLVDGYLKAYNSEHYQYDLAGLTPEEFYQYATTGVYPLDNYFGVPASIMMTGGDLKKVRRRYADEEAAARREASQKHREEKRLVDPEKVILRDQRLLKSVIDKWKDKEMTASNQITKMQAVLEKAKSALQFIKSLTEDKRSELKEPLAWRKYTELSYVFIMNELF